MLSISRLIADKTDTIMVQWIEAVRKDRRIESIVNLSDTALGDSLPKLLQSLPAVLAHSQNEFFKEIAEESLEHGNLRTSQGYDAAEIAQEYSLLRRLQQILTNLLSNAVRYTDNGFIKVSCQSLPSDKWLFAVTDTGIGIALEDRKRIFELFSQAFFNQGRRKHEGTGLRLAIVSRLVKLLQGEIQLVSQVEVGSTFTVTLPLSTHLDNRIGS